MMLDGGGWVLGGWLDKSRLMLMLMAGWEPINTNIPENIGVGSQYWGLSIGEGGILNKIIF